MLWSVTFVNIGTDFDLDFIDPLSYSFDLDLMVTLPLACPELVDEQGGTHSQVTTLGKPVQGKYK